MANLESSPQAETDNPACGAYITLELIPVVGTGLEYYNVSLSFVNENLNAIVSTQRYDSHWQEETAWACAERWSKRLGVPIYRYPLKGV